MDATAETVLLSRCRAGDARAWDELFDKYYAAAARFVFQLGHDFTQDDVEEICHEVFLSVIKHIDSFQGQSQFQTWLFRIAVNKARDFRERARAAKRGGGATPISLQAEDPETGLAVDPPTTGPGPDDLLMKGQRVALVGQSLGQLGDPCREIIELRYFGDLSYDEIVAVLSLNVKTVSSRLSKCLDRIEIIVRELFSREKIEPFAVQ
jgi:RNA polymerase sigma-70 factor, ECF subfamily